MKNAQGPVVEVDPGRNPATENGPFSTESDEKAENVRQVAAKVVEEVISRAAEAASQQHWDDTPSGDDTRNRPIQPLPTIQVDTVPSIPPSPEEEEEVVVTKTYQPLKGIASEELRDFMTSYVDDIVCRAIVRAEQELNTRNDEVRQVAAKVIEDIVSKAAEVVSEKKVGVQLISLGLEMLPTIQIDTVPSMPPSPEEPPPEPVKVEPKKKKSRKKDSKEKKETETPSGKDVEEVRIEEKRKDVDGVVPTEIEEEVMKKEAEPVTVEEAPVPEVKPRTKKGSKKKPKAASERQQAKVMEKDTNEEAVRAEDVTVEIKPKIEEATQRTGGRVREEPESKTAAQAQPPNGEVKVDEKPKVIEGKDPQEVKREEAKREAVEKPEMEPKLVELNGEPQVEVKGEAEPLPEVAIKRDEVKQPEADSKSEGITEKQQEVTEVRPKSEEVAAQQETKTKPVDEKPNTEELGEPPEVKPRTKKGPKKRKAEEEAARKAQEEAEAAKRAQEEAVRLAQEEAEVAKRAQEEAEAAKRAQEEAETAKRAQEEAETAKRAQEAAEAAKREREEAETAKRAVEDAKAAKRAVEEAEAAKRAVEDAEAAKRAVEEAEAAKRAVEDAKRAVEDAKRAKEVQDTANKAQEKEEAAKRAKEEEEERKGNSKDKEDAKVMTMGEDTRSTKSAKEAVNKGKIEVVAEVTNNETTTKSEAGSEIEKEVNRQEKAPSDKVGKLDVETEDVSKKGDSEEAPPPQWMVAPTVVIDSPKDSEQDVIDVTPSIDELRDFAASYVNDIISKALSQTEEKRNYLVSQLGFAQGCSLTKSTRPWYIRAREAIADFIRVACFCGSRREDS